MRDPYEVLGLPEDATPRQVKRAWRRLARAFHPDLNHESDAAERFREIAEAFEAAVDASRRPRPTVRRRGWGPIAVDVRVTVRPLTDEDWLG
ncbi:MAG: DnaJ domain-containing protein [Myxococcales bacterium]